MKKDTPTKEESPFRRFRRNMEGLSMEQKIDHIWAYYRGTVLLMILIPVAVVLLLVSVFRDKPEVAFAGNFSNAILNEDGQSYLINNWLQLLDLEPGTAAIKLDHSATMGKDMGTNGGFEVDAGLQVAVSVAANELDYIVCDSVAMEFYAVQGAFLPLDEVLSEEQMAQYADQIYYYTDAEDGQTAAAALNMTDHPFFKDCVTAEGDIYLCFANKEEPLTQRLLLFLQHLDAWEAFKP